MRMNAYNVFMQPLLLFLASNEVNHMHDKGLCERSVLSAMLLVNLVSSAFMLTEGFSHFPQFVQEKGKDV